VPVNVVKELFLVYFLISGGGIMATVVQSIEINAPVEECFDVICDFENYPKFLDGMKKVKVLKQTEDNAHVQFTLDLFKRITYTLDMKMDAPGSVTWTLADADLMKKNEGGWTLTKKSAKKTKAEYKIDIDFTIWVPGPIADFLINSSVPATLESFKKRIESM